MNTLGRTVIVTGATGFVGRHLIAFLLDRGEMPVALTIPGDTRLFTLPREVDWIACDIRDGACLQDACTRIKPQVIYHLAGIVRGTDLERYLSINVHGTDVLLRAAAQLPCPPRVIIPGSASEYGILQTQHPANEQTPLRPISNYGVSKALQTLLGLSYALRGELPVIVGRVFNITGPAEPEGMLCGSIASQVAAIEFGEQSPILRVGNLSPFRDYVDVRDMVCALWLLSFLGLPGQVYNIASGRATQVETVVRTLVSLSEEHINIVRDQARQRPSDIPYCAGDYTLLHHRTGWEPERTLTESLRDTLEWWRATYRERVVEPIAGN